ncbi:MAG: 4a-hydroxytetrahydrobiopterin dehydratase [Planctomycetota bacterium]
MTQKLEKLSEADIKTHLERLAEWSEIGGEIQRTFEFGDFLEAMAFVNQVAEAAETRQHHPDILIRYNRVMLTLSTHDAGGITEKDFDLAAHCDELAS